MITSLADDDGRAREAFGGPTASPRPAAEDQVVLEMSTIAPRTVREIGPRRGASGAPRCSTRRSRAASPVSEQGELTIMVGGDAAAMERGATGPGCLGREGLPRGSRRRRSDDEARRERDHPRHRRRALRGARARGEGRGGRGPPPTTCSRPAPRPPRSSCTSDRRSNIRTRRAVAFILELMAKDLDLILELAGRGRRCRWTRPRRNRATVRGALDGRVRRDAT